MVVAAAVLLRPGRVARSTASPRSGCCWRSRSSRRSRSCGRCSPTRAGTTPDACSPTAACSPPALALVRVAPERWPAVLGGIALAAVVVCGYALLTKVFPGKLAPDEHLRTPERTVRLLERDRADRRDGRDLLHVARRAPHRARAAERAGLSGDGRAAADADARLLARRAGGAGRRPGAVVLRRAAAPARRRRADPAAASARARWRRGTSPLMRSARKACRWPNGRRRATSSVRSCWRWSLALDARGRRDRLPRRPPCARRWPRAGRRACALLAVLALLALGFAGALAHSHRGFTGSISHAVDSLTNPNAKPPPNTPDRLTAVASVRARYWKEALQVFEAHPALGAGAEGYATARLRYRTETLERAPRARLRRADARRPRPRRACAWRSRCCAAGWPPPGARRIPSTARWAAGDRGAAALAERRGTADWRRAGSAARPIHARARRPAEHAVRRRRVRRALAGRLDLVRPGDACVALLCAGWLAGRGSAAAAAPAGAALAPSARRVTAPACWPPRRWAGRERRARRARRRRGDRVAALLAAWSQWQPQRSEDARQRRSRRCPRTTTARRARRGEQRASRATRCRPKRCSRSPTSQHVTGQAREARATLGRAVRLQPSNPQTWLELGRFDLQRATRGPRCASCRRRST